MNDDSHDDNDAPNGPLDVFITNTTRGFLLPEKEMDVQPPDGAFLEISATGRAPFFFLLHGTGRHRAAGRDQRAA